jgi:hypothetical protein
MPYTELRIASKISRHVPMIVENLRPSYYSSILREIASRFQNFAAEVDRAALVQIEG